MTQHDTRPLIVGLGEAMVRLSPPHKVPLEMATDLEVHVAGSELNLLIAATALGARGRWLTRLPANELGVMIRRHALSYGIDVVAQEEEDGRAGLLFLELGAPPRPSSVLYDRENSAAAHLRADEFAWDEVLAGAGAAHVTGVTCALGEGPLSAALALLGAARDLGVMTSFDVNYRSQLWDIDAARASYLRVLGLVDTLFVSPGDLALICGKDGESDDLAEDVVEEFGVSTIVVRERCEVSLHELGAKVRVRGEADSTSSASAFVVDELGAGDAAAGAFLASMLHGESRALSAERCVRAYARMLTIPGDSWTGSLHDLSDGYAPSRRVVR
jgi:2-dehydro-3-deoxygluconokinase